MISVLKRRVAIVICVLAASAGCGRDEEARPVAAEATAVADPGDWCAGHGVPESMCPKCNAGVEEKYRAAGDWCEEHGYPESVCPSCNPVAPPGSARATAVADPGDWCAGHGVPESMCPKCNAGVEEKYRAEGDWCEAHGYPESVCPSCNPVAPPGSVRATAAADPGDWCAGHGVPESMCPKCNAGVEEKYRAAGDWCEEHGYPESVCPSCNPVTPPAGPTAATGTRIRFRSASLEQTAGIEIQLAEEADIALGVGCTARIDFDRNRLADVRTVVPGLVREVAVDLGQQVEQGALLFVLESAHVGDLTARRTAARERVETARANLARLEDLRARQIPSARQVELARQELEAAEAEFRSIVESLKLTGGARSGVSGHVTIRSPRGGTIVRRPAVLGAFASEADSLATVADTSRMWALLDVHERDASMVRVGQKVAVEVDGVPDRIFRGTVSWIASEVDARTRTVTARVEVDNQAGLLRAQQFARANIEVAPPSRAVAVPAESVQRLEDGPVVFVRTAPLVYEPRSVELGRTRGRQVQIVSDVRPGDPVVTTGAFLLKTELMRGSIGAGCCEIDTPGGDE